MPIEAGILVIGAASEQYRFLRAHLHHAAFMGDGLAPQPGIQGLIALILQRKRGAVIIEKEVILNELADAFRRFLQGTAKAAV